MLCSHENENPDGTIQKLETKAAEQNTCNVFFLLFHSFKLDNCSGNKKIIIPATKNLFQQQNTSGSVW